MTNTENPTARFSEGDEVTVTFGSLSGHTGVVHSAAPSGRFFTVLVDPEGKDGGRLVNFHESDMERMD